MQYLHDLTNGECGVHHVPNGTAANVKLRNAGVDKLDVCPQDARLDHVRYPAGWTVTGSEKEGQPAIIICRHGQEFARIVPAPGNEFTLVTKF